MAEFEMIDRERKELLDGISARDGRRSSRREIAAAVGIESHMDGGLLEDHFVEGELGPKQRADLEAGDNAVHVGQRSLGGRLATVDRDVAYVSLKAKGFGVDAADFDATTGDAL